MRHDVQTAGQRKLATGLDAHLRPARLDASRQSAHGPVFRPSADQVMRRREACLCIEAVRTVPRAVEDEPGRFDADPPAAGSGVHVGPAPDAVQGGRRGHRLAQFQVPPELRAVIAEAMALPDGGAGRAEAAALRQGVREGEAVLRQGSPCPLPRIVQAEQSGRQRLVDGCAGGVLLDEGRCRRFLFAD